MAGGDNPVDAEIVVAGENHEPLSDDDLEFLSEHLYRFMQTSLDVDVRDVQARTATEDDL
jgi:hypothetical protein